MQTNSAVEQNKNVNGFRVHGISPAGVEKVHGGKDLPKSGLCVVCTCVCVCVCEEIVK